MDEKFLNVDWTQEPPRFGGEPGEPVPAVDPEDVKTVWQIGRDAQASNGCGVAIGADLVEQACKPGAEIVAVSYRASFIWLMSFMAPEDLRFVGQPSDEVFHAAAKVTAEWMGVGIVRDGPPFDVNEFLRLCEEEIV